MAVVARRILREIPLRGGPIMRYEIPGWRQRYGVVAGVTGRPGDFALGRDPDRRAGQRPGPLSRLVEALAPGFRSVAVSQQVHGTAVRTHEDAGAELLVEHGFDGQVTRRAGLLLGVTVADCIPIYLVHPSTGAISLLHAGWRGAVDGILVAGVKALCELAQAIPPEIVMHCGVGICGQCYEVSSEVLRRLGEGVSHRTAHLDLRRWLARKAERLGVGQVTLSDWCTAHGGDRFHSHRRSRGQAGRMLAYLGRPLEPDGC